ncbi:MAG: glycosyltransferase family 39 protein [Kiritimatiellaeota bacterium]|nr:glycosyltransferase family 39 protein [Kiritimatiellota bacterium]
MSPTQEHRGGRSLRASSTNLPRWLVGLCLLISLCGIFNHELWTPDEPREAALILAMSHPGHGGVPHLAGKPFVEKPPLYYLLSAYWLRLGSAQGQSAGWLRLSSALWGLGTLGMTFLLARRLYDRATARLAVVILATMPGFIHVTHWLLVDNALMFFLVAAFWALTAAYQGARPGFLPLAGLLAAGAFLVKGLVGPLLIGVGWLGLFIPWWLNRDLRAAPEDLDRNSGLYATHGQPAPNGIPKFADPSASLITHHPSLGTPSLLRAHPFLFHVPAVVLFLAPVLAWAAIFYATAGRALFMEWFWTNHVGRFSGSAMQLGHIAGPFYYLGALPVYVLPWLAVLACGVGNAVIKIRARATLTADLTLPLAWGLGGVLLLSLAATKREIYLGALLPALALLAARTLRRPLPRWAAVYQRLWNVVLLLVSVAALLEACWLAPRALPDANGPMAARMLWMLPALLAVTAGFVIWRNQRLTALVRAAGVTALSAIALLTIAGPTLEKWKDYRPAFTHFEEELKAHPALQPAAWELDETTRAGFYWYTGLTFPALRAAGELQAVLQGRGPGLPGVTQPRGTAGRAAEAARPGQRGAHLPEGRDPAAARAGKISRSGRKTNGPAAHAAIDPGPVRAVSKELRK